MDLSLIKRVNHITSPYTMLKNWHNGITGSYFSIFLVTVSYSILKKEEIATLILVHCLDEFEFYHYLYILIYMSDILGQYQHIN